MYLNSCVQGERIPQKFIIILSFITHLLLNPPVLLLSKISVRVFLHLLFSGMHFFLF